MMLLGALPHSAVAASPIAETCAGWPLPGKTTTFDGPNRWQHVGNHRAKVLVSEIPTDGSNAVRVIIPWARHDTSVETKGIVVMSSETALVVPNCSTLSAPDEADDLASSASEGPGLYHVYYLPYANGKYVIGAQKLAVPMTLPPGSPAAALTWTMRSERSRTPASSACSRAQPLTHLARWSWRRRQLRWPPS